MCVWLVGWLGLDGKIFFSAESRRPLVHTPQGGQGLRFIGLDPKVDGASIRVCVLYWLEICGIFVMFTRR